MTTVVRAGVPSDVGAAVAVWQSANTARRGGIPVPVEHEHGPVLVTIELTFTLR